ncbi:MAG: hypothetical protein IJI68_12610, partial [Eggerthellaceae bacterium]|nr:hypothetical protein [Eggerthellaceae bacterium]
VVATGFLAFSGRLGPAPPDNKETARFPNSCGTTIAYLSPSARKKACNVGFQLVHPLFRLM